MSKHVIFAIAFCIASFIANFYIYKFFLSAIFTRYKKILRGFFIICFCLNVLFLFLMRSDFLYDKVYLILSLILAFSFFFFLIGIFYSICLGVLQSSNFSAGRRKSLKFIFDIGFLFIAMSCFLKGVFNALKTPSVNKITIKARTNLKIALITDVHLGKNVHKNFLVKIIQEVNKHNVDFVAIVGDLIDTNIKEINYLDELNTFNAPVFYVTGNHEYYHNVDEIIEQLSKTKLQILQNDSINFKDVVISGLNDLSGAKYNKAPNFINIYQKFDANKYNILLTHQPRMAKEFNLEKFDLVLSGHTHAGQIFPFSILVYLQQGFLYGLYELGKKTKLYVSSGAGFWGPSVRFLAPSEIAIINLETE